MRIGLCAVLYLAFVATPADASRVGRVTVSSGEIVSEIDVDQLHLDLRLDVADDGIHWRLTHRTPHERLGDGYGITLTAGKTASVGVRRVGPALHLHRFEGTLPGVGANRKVRVMLTRPRGLSAVELGVVQTEVPDPFVVTSPPTGATVRTSEPMQLELRGHDATRVSLDHALEGDDACIHDELRRAPLGVRSPAWQQLGIVAGKSCDATLHVLGEVRHERDFALGRLQMYRRASVPLRIIEDVKDTGISVGTFDDLDVVDPVRQQKVRAGTLAPSAKYSVDLARAQFDVELLYGADTFQIEVQRQVWAAAHRAHRSSGEYEGIVVVDGVAHAFSLGTVNRYSGTVDEHTFAMPRRLPFVDVYARHPAGRVFALGRFDLPPPPRLDIRPRPGTTVSRRDGAKISVKGPPGQLRWEVTFEETDSPESGCAAPGINGAASNQDLAPREIVFRGTSTSCKGTLDVVWFSTHQRAPSIIADGALPHDGQLSFVRSHVAFRERAPLRFVK